MRRYGVVPVLLRKTAHLSEEYKNISITKFTSFVTSLFCLLNWRNKFILGAITHEPNPNPRYVLIIYWLIVHLQPELEPVPGWPGDLWAGSRHLGGPVGGQSPGCGQAAQHGRRPTRALHQVPLPTLLEYLNSVMDPWHFGTDPDADPRIRTSD
jgi:hypothetical protein